MVVNKAKKTGINKKEDKKGAGDFFLYGLINQIFKEA
jgi:hypothetical protein